jgi:hypothetical protein
MSWQIPAGTVIPAFGYRLVWADGHTGQNGEGTNGDLHASFNLRAGGEAIGLFARDGTNLVQIDAVTFGQQFANVSEGRYPDGNAHREYMPTFTPRAPNVSTNTSNNTAPTLTPVPDAVVLLGQMLSFTVTAQDAEAPQQVLTYSLVGPVPDGATINPATGLFQWTPTEQSASSNFFTVRVTDDGVPSLSDTDNFVVFVVPPPTSTITPPLPNGDMSIGFATIPGRHYRVEYKDDLAESSWNPLAGYENVLATGSSLSVTVNLADSPQRFYQIVVLD